MNTNNIKPSYTYKDRNKKCSECEIVSTTVERSVKYNKLLCIECLKDKILSDIQSYKD
jgi:formylmethanofuran dehydrogenase subunit E